MTMNSFCFVLGAIDPEMFTIARCLTAAGCEWEWAAPPGTAEKCAALTQRAIDAQNCGAPESEWAALSAEAKRLRSTPIRQPAAAYACEDRRSAQSGHTRTFVWVECRPAGVSRAALEARGDDVIDHHDLRHDPEASAPPEHAAQASSIGQVFRHARGVACGQDGAYRTEDEAAPLVRLFRLMSDPDAHRTGHAMRSDLRIAAALDHCLFAALGGLVPGVDRDAALRAAAEMAADHELAALKGVEPEAETPEAFIALIEAAQAILRDAPKLRLGGLEVCDLLSHSGKIHALPVAAAHAMLAYVVEAPARPGVPTTCTIGGATTPAAVRVFAEVAREAFEALLASARSDAALDAVRLESHESGLAFGRVRELESIASQGAARGGVYSMPERGIAGAYLAAAVLAPRLRCPMERAFADMLAGDSAFAHCLHLACEHATASADATAEIRALRETARAAVNRGWQMGRVHG